MELPVEEERQAFLFDDLMAEMEGMEGRLFFKQIKMKIRYWSISIRSILKQIMVKMGELKTNMEQMLMTSFLPCLWRR
jgi:hypothetical protein